MAFHKDQFFCHKLLINYINDLCNAQNIFKLTLFANDSTIFHSDNDISALGEIVQNWKNSSLGLMSLDLHSM